MERKIKMISTFITFLLSIFLFTISTLILIITVILSKGSLKESVEKSEYYRGVQSQSLEGAKDFLIPTGLPADILEGAFSLGDVKILVDAGMNDGLEFELIEKIRNKNKEVINNNIQAYIAQLSQSIEVQSSNTDEIVNNLVDYFLSNTKIPFISQIIRLQDMYQMIAMFSAMGLCILSMAMLIFLYKLIPWYHIFLRYCTYCLGGTAGLLMIIPGIIRITELYKRVDLSPEYLYKFFIFHIDKGLQSFVYTGAVCLTLAVVMGFLAEIKRKDVVNNQ